MKKNKLFNLSVILMVVGVFMLSSYKINDAQENIHSLKFPFKKAGLTERQAAAHLLNRFTYGATPKQIDEVVNIGIENWFLQQLEAKQPDDSLNAALASYETLSLNNNQIFNTYVDNGQVRRLAIKEGVLKEDSARNFDYKTYKNQLDSFMKAKGLKQEGELIRQLINQKILRAAYTNNQLQEVMTSFWFNHFNVSLTKNDCIRFVTCYEKDVIRPNALGKFSDLLLGTAQSPAMLTYLDNFRSVAGNNNNNSEAGAKRLRELYKQQQALKNGDTTSLAKDVNQKIKKFKASQGLNENYAREIMELHTLGVDGGYTQTDVTNAAKVLTGWTIYPMEENGLRQINKMIDNVGMDKLKAQGFKHEGDFLFAVNKHDKSEVTILNTNFTGTEGYDEGTKLIYLLAHHNSTAHFICKKLAVRFVSDNPPKSLIDKMAKTFLDKDGDIKQVLITMVSAPEFWNKEALRTKIKSPFELTMSTVRAFGAKITQPYQLFNWVNKMGEKMYYYQAPTGFPDKAQYWINTGSLLNRMNFGLAIASQRIAGVNFNLLSLNDNHEPESAEAALTTYCKLLMPERNLDETIKRLIPLINDPEIHKKIDDAAGKSTPASTTMVTTETMNNDEMMMTGGNKKILKEKIGKKKVQDYTIQQLQVNAGNKSMLAQVTGIIVGSPEFQRR